MNGPLASLVNVLSPPGYSNRYPKEPAAIDNPYSPPTTASHRIATADNRLLYIWIWIPTAAFGAMLATPADPFLIIGAMIFALPAFFVGIAWRSKMSPAARVTALAVCGVVGIGIASMTWPFATWPSPDIFYTIAAIVFAIANVTLGVLAGGQVLQHRRRIFAALGVSYSVGVLLGPLGCLLFAVPSVLVANRRDEGRVTKP